MDKGFIHMGIWRRRQKRSGERGQIAILFALVFTFMFILFCFVVDISHLINTKMNLQIAADAAAYAGAAWQARSLNRIGQVNYRLRQTLKEFAMKVQVTHLRHNRNFPRGSEFINGGDQSPSTEPFICQQAHGYKALSGLKYANDTNLCRNASPSTGGLPPIVVPPVIAAFDPFAQAIAAQIRKIAEAANNECRAAANDNRQLAEHLVAVYTRRSQFHSQQIQDLAGWLNETAGGQLNDSETHPIRAVAYQSALRNLGSGLRNNFKVEILAPEGGEYIRVTPQTMRGSLFFINFNVVGDGCVGRPSFLDFDGLVPLVTKEQSIITYFAVKLSVKPTLFFMPQAWADAFPLLEATSAAKPFGSRIGPSVTADQLVPVQNRPGNNNRMVNFSFRPGDNLGIMNTKVMALLDAFHPTNSASRPDGFQDTGWPDMDPTKRADKTALQAIRAPTIFDAILYTIFPDPNRGDDYFESDYALSMFPDYQEAADPAGNLIQTPQSPTAAYHPASIGSKNRGNGFIQIDAPAQNGGAYGGYANESPASHSVTLTQGIPTLEGNPTSFGWATKEMVHSGWKPANGQPRIGYSVKFIGMDALMRTLRVKQNDTGARGPIANKPTGDPNLVEIYH